MKSLHDNIQNSIEYLEQNKHEKLIWLQFTYRMQQVYSITKHSSYKKWANAVVKTIGPYSVPLWPGLVYNKQ